MDSSGHLRYLSEDEQPAINEMLVTEDEAKVLQKQPLRKRKNWMRNKPCICESGKKFKHCCWTKFAREGGKTYKVNNA